MLLDMDVDKQALKQYSPEELAQGDGKEGRPALIVYRGKVYDVTGSRLWRNGVHVKAHQAGNDLTSSMGAAPHEDNVMERFRPVGVFAEEPTPGLRIPPPLFEFVLSKHPHPISVHFPIALGMVAGLFTFISLFASAEPLHTWMRQAALYNLIIAAIGTPPAVATGLLSWYYNYSSVWTPIYRAKTYLSILLCVMTIAALVIRFACMNGAESGGTWYWIYSLLLLAHAPTVLALGYFGGKITFPA
jgi:predicted heme/steroid binding protein/uncharacterized membrane protein